jgi:hypothetical protein
VRTALEAMSKRRMGAAAHRVTRCMDGNRIILSTTKIAHA